MDEGTLNDLLECSVCFDRLDTSSKVLPCQHTFCRKCLQEITHKHKELRCPECRILVHVKVDDLPPNVLLMRILEGMRNANASSAATSIVVKRPGRGGAREPNPVDVGERKIGAPESGVKQSAVSPHQPYAKAVYDYEPREVGDLSFKRGDIIYLKQRMDAHWYEGECDGKHGIFPISYVQIVTPQPSHVPQCKALYDFQTGKHEEEGCLVFKEGDIINVIRRVDENWAEGKLEGRIGIFPLTFVELNNLARSLMKLSTNAQPGPSRVAPPTPTSEDTTPLIPTDHSRTVVPQQQPNPVHSIQQSDSNVSSGSSTTTPNVSSSNNSNTSSSNSSTAPSSPASPPPRGQLAAVPRLSQKPELLLTPQRVAANNKDKRHSLTNPTPHHPIQSTNHRHSTEILQPLPTSSPSGTGEPTPPPHLPAKHKTRNNVPPPPSDDPHRSAPKLLSPYIALYPYRPQKGDELELKKGAYYIVTERCQDGWFKGTSNRTQKCGVFPGNYVTPLARFGGGGASGDVTAARGGGGESSVSFARGSSAASRSCGLPPPPELPPRAASPSVAKGDHQQGHHGNNKSKDQRNKDKSGVGLIRRLTSKRSKSPPPPTYSMDNPVFEDSTTTITPQSHPIHVRSGSCPSQLLQMQPAEHHRLFAGSTSQRLKQHKERPSVLTAHNLRSSDTVSSSTSVSSESQHRKSNSLDAGNNRVASCTGSAVTSKTGQHEMFRCEIPYPPNSEYELELQKGDIIYVHRKREDGWYKGTLQRTGRTGLFPASFVKPV